MSPVFNFNKDSAPVKASPYAWFGRMLVINRTWFMTKRTIILVLSEWSGLYTDVLYSIRIVINVTILNNSILAIQKSTFPSERSIDTRVRTVGTPDRSFPVGSTATLLTKSTAAKRRRLPVR